MDIYGRMTLAEIREGTWDYLTALYPDTTSLDGTTSDTYRIDPLFPKKVIDRLLNQSLTAHFVDLVVGAPDTFADAQCIDVVADVVEYALPADVAFLRSLWWKDYDTSPMIQPPSERTLMLYFDQDSKDILCTLNSAAPTYRRQLNNIVLNETPDRDNAQGIEVRYIKWINPLFDDNLVIESEYARILQEVIMLDAAIAASSRRSSLDTTELRKDLSAWEARLLAAAGLSNSTPFKQLVYYHPMTIGE